MKKQGRGGKWQTPGTVKRPSLEEAMAWMDFVLQEILEMLEEKKADIMVFAIDLLKKLQAKEDLK